MSETGASVNAHYTFNYVQPDAYRFSHDSVFLARRAFELLRPKLRPGLRLLDLCAGCGVVGLEFLFHARAEAGVDFAAADFVDVQPEYEPYFTENLGRANLPGLRARFLNINATELAAPPYDVVLCNPPYFEPGRGKPPATRFRTRCHFLVDAPWADLARVIERSVAARGDAFVVVREPSRCPLPGAVDRGPVRAARLLHLRRA